MTVRTTLAAVAVLGAIVTAGAQEPDGATRIKDVVSLQGVRSTPVVGYGLVAGLNKTGDKRQTIFSAQTLANMLERFGVSVPAEQIKIENIAAVLVTAELPPFARAGTRLEVTASSFGDAGCIKGGVLLQTGVPGRGGSLGGYYR